MGGEENRLAVVELLESAEAVPEPLSQPGLLPPYDVSEAASPPAAAAAAATTYNAFERLSQASQALASKREGGGGGGGLEAEELRRQQEWTLANIPLTGGGVGPAEARGRREAVSGNSPTNSPTHTTARPALRLPTIAT